MPSIIRQGRPPATARQRNTALAALLLVVMGAPVANNAALARPPSSASPARPHSPPIAPLYTEAAEQFLSLYEEAGMLGAATVIDECYKRAAPTATERCLAFDSVAQVMTDSWAKNGFPAPLNSLTRPAFDARMKKQLRLQGTEAARVDSVIRRMLDQAAAALLMETEKRRQRKLGK